MILQTVMHWGVWKLYINYKMTFRTYFDFGTMFWSVDLSAVSRVCHELVPFMFDFHEKAQKQNKDGLHNISIIFI